jgi:hypothetical protein
MTSQLLLLESKVNSLGMDKAHPPLQIKKLQLTIINNKLLSLWDYFHHLVAKLHNKRLSMNN